MSGNELNRLATVFANPIWVKCARTRLRWGPVLSWGTVTVVVTAFVCTLVFVVAREEGGATPTVAAKATLLPIVIIQGILLMLMGTGAVASRLSFEREIKLLDYQRMTPMAPLAKIIGYLFGLPVREYFLFALTLPFLAFALIKGGFAAEKIVPFYVVFFSSAVLYHLTGMVAGMASAKPRRAQLMSQGMIILLYLFLPQMSRLGLTFFEFLTIVPTFNGLLLDELNAVSPGLDQAATQAIPLVGPYRDVPFFGMLIHPTIFTMFVQGFLIVTMVVVIYRKWINEAAHIFTKFYGFLFHGITLVLVVGNLWPAIVEQRYYGLLTEMMQNEFTEPSDPRPLQGLLFLLLMLFGILAAASNLLVIHFVTPSREVTLKGLRRARKMGRSHPGLDSDAASSLPVALLTSLMTVGAWLVLLEAAEKSGVYVASWPGTVIVALPLLLHVSVVLLIQGLRERFSIRACLMLIFGLWIVPSFVALIRFAAGGGPILATSLAMPMPPFALFAMLDEIFQHATALDVANGQPVELLVAPISEHRTTMVVASSIGFAALAVTAQVMSIRFRRRLHRLAGETPLPQFEPGVLSTDQSSPTAPADH